MKLKIGIMIIFIILSINNVYCETDSYKIEYYIDNSKAFGGGISSGQPFAGINILDVDTITDVSFFECWVLEDRWAGGTQNSNFSYANLYSDYAHTNYIGRGIIGYIKDGTSGYRVQLHILSLNWGALSGHQKLYWVADDALDSMQFNTFVVGYGLENGYGIWCGQSDLSQSCGGESTHTTKIKYVFENNIEYFYNSTYNYYELTLFRNSTFQSMWYVNDSYTLWKNETSLKQVNETIYSFDLDNSTWNTYVTTDNNDIIELNIDFSLLYDEKDEDAPTLTTDKTYYNTNEEITISYTNIQTIYDECTGYTYNHKCEHPYELYILYPIYSDNPYNQWGAKYQMYIPYYYATDGTGIKYDDGSITLNTSILSPQNTYVLGLVGKNGYYGKTDDIILMSDSFTVYPANEYLNTNCEGREVYVGTDIIIYYKIDNNSNIIIKDNDNNIINQYYNIINEGELIYTIPGDLNHLNTYPNWKIYLNNTDYATSYNQDLTVYWSLFESPTETPTILPTETPDINISDQLDNLNTEVKPLKDLMFGLVYIVVDNPDYNTDNIVSENEINNWLNSIIPLCLFLCLIILYIGLHKKRE